MEEVIRQLQGRLAKDKRPEWPVQGILELKQHQLIFADDEPEHKALAYK